MTQDLLDKLEKYNILFVEDDELLCSLIEETADLLGITNYNIVHTGKDAIDIMITKNIDILITDIGLPDMTGIDLIQQSKDKFIIAVTGYIADYYKEQILEAGANLVLHKPFDFIELFENLNEYINKGR